MKVTSSESVFFSSSLMEASVGVGGSTWPTALCCLFVVCVVCVVFVCLLV